MTENTHGGARSRSGRKPVEDKKVTVSIYPQKSRVELLGADNVKEIALAAIEKEYRKILKK